MTDQPQDQNLELLRLDLINSGVRLSRSAMVHPVIAQMVELYRETGTGLEINLRLAGDVVARLPVQVCMSGEGAYRLVERDGSYVIESGAGLEIEVEIEEPPSYYSLRTSSGLPMASVGKVYGAYLLISPSGYCQFISDGIPCRYCEVSEKGYEDRSVDDVLETVAAAVETTGVRSVCLTAGYRRGDDSGIDYLKPYIRALKSEFELLVAVQAQPPAEDRWIDQTYAMGVDSVAYNLELYDPELFKRIAPGKMGVIGRDRYLDALGRAAKVFPQGAVVSNLILGLEPVEVTMRGIDALTSMGVIPTLPVYRPPGGGRGVDSDDLVKAYLHLQEVLREKRLAPTWISHFNMAVNAFDGRFFGGEAPAEGRWSSVFQTRAGGKLALNISKVRRRLRVREVKEAGDRG